MSSKRCTNCGLMKPLSDFYAMRGMRDRHRNDCIDCNKAAKRERHARNPEPYRERLGKLRDNPEILLRAIVYVRQRRSA